MYAITPYFVLALSPQIVLAQGDNEVMGKFNGPGCYY
jgi:hypothetical protein